MSAATLTPGSEVIWQDAECGAYRADLPLWERLAAEAAGEILDLGAGCGRVALHLAARGHRLFAVDSDPELLAGLRERARRSGIESIETHCADARELALDRRFALVIAPMQLIHLLGGEGERRRTLAAIDRHLVPGGIFCAALLDDSAALSSGTPEPLPDVRELDGWVHSSLPLEVRAGEDGIELRRLRQLVSPAGELREERVLTRLAAIAPERFEREAAALGFAARPRVPVPETADHVASVICRLEARR